MTNMEQHMYALIGVLLAITAGLYWAGSSGETHVERSAAFTKFQRSYLAVWSIAIIADWLQGPYVYALYESYGFSNADNAILFIFGFGSSGVFGAFMGQFADTHGRKMSASLYCVLVMASCFTKHFNQFHVLMLGRVLGGMATSLVFSVFESWMVSEHTVHHKFDDASLSDTFGQQQFLSSVMAISAGLMAQTAANAMSLTNVGGSFHVGGYCSPFDLAFLAALFCLLLIIPSWSENFGAQETGSMMEGVTAAATHLKDPRIFTVGMIAALFESSMYLWVFIWTPAITPATGPKPPYGLIFTAFMVACMMGSKLFSFLAAKYETEQVLLGTLVLGLGAHGVMLHAVWRDETRLLAAFIVFEIAVGLYFPAMGTLKSKVVPEECRTTIYNIYRIPLNIVVVLGLYFKANPSDTLGTTTTLMLLAVGLNIVFVGGIGSAKQSYAVVGGERVGKVEFDP